jgi:DNA uptake protein ComE-like DNA-binding protein
VSADAPVRHVTGEKIMAKDVRTGKKGSQSSRLRAAPQRQALPPQNVAKPPTQTFEAVTRLEGKLDKLTDQFGQFLGIMQNGLVFERAEASKEAPKPAVAAPVVSKSATTPPSAKAQSVRPPSNERIARPATSPKDEDSENPGDESLRHGDNMIELNTANYRDLRRIPMMGEGRAHMILDYRTRLSGFRTWDEVENIPGISKGMLGKLQEYCTVSGNTIEDEISMSMEQEQREKITPLKPGSIRPEQVTPLVTQLLENVKDHVTPEEQQVMTNVLKRVSSRPPPARK